MKWLLSLFLVLMSGQAWASVYYFSNAGTGTKDGLSDTNSATKADYQNGVAPFNALTTADTVYGVGTLTATACNTTGGHTLSGAYPGTVNNQITCTNASNVTIEHWSMRNGGYSCINYIGGANGIIQDNTIYNCGGSTSNDDGISLGTGATNLIVRRNIVGGQKSSGGSGIDYSGMSGSGAGSALITDNYVYGSIGRGLGFSADPDNGDVVIYADNIIYDTNSGIEAYKCGTLKLYNNTFVNQRGIALAFGYNPPCNGVTDTKLHVTSKNNIAVCTNGSCSGQMAISNASTVDYVADNNIFLRQSTGSGNIVYYNGVGKSFVQTQALTSQDVNSKEANPMLMPDYSLMANSPAVDAGVTIPEVTDDYSGNKRPWGSAYDIGAKEQTYGIKYSGVNIN